MKKFFKRSFASLIAVIMLLTTCAYALEITTFSEDLTVYLNGMDVYENSVNKPLIINDRTLVPLRPIFEAMGWSNEEIIYDDTEKKAYFQGGDCSCEFINDNNIAIKYNTDGTQSEYELDVPATIYNGNFYIPLRAFCDLWGFNISWNSDTRTVTILSQSSAAPVTVPTVVSNDADIPNLDWYPKEHMAIEHVVHAGIMPLSEDGNFDGETPMTVGEVNQVVANLAAYIAQTYNAPEFTTDIPQITGKPADETATLNDVFELLNDPGVQLIENNPEWVELNQSRLLAALKAVYKIITPDTSVAEVLRRLEPLPSHVVLLLYEAMDSWRLLTDDWSYGYTKQNNGVSTSTEGIAAFDGETYFYVIDEDAGSNSEGIYSETNGQVLLLENASNKRDLDDVVIIGAYNGYMFFSYDNSIFRTDAKGQYEPLPVAQGKIGSIMSGTKAIVYKDAVLSGNEIYYCLDENNTEKYYKSPVTASNFKLDECRTEITYEEWESAARKVDGHMYSADHFPGYGNNSSWWVEKNEKEIDMHSSYDSVDFPVITYNGYIYHIITDKSGVSYLHKVDINGQNCVRIAEFNNDDVSSFNRMSVCGDYIFVRFDQETTFGAERDEYYRININDNSVSTEF